MLLLQFYLTRTYSSTGKSSGISTGVTIGYGDGTQTSVDAVKVSASQSKMNSNGTTYQNGRFVNVDEVHNNTKNMTLSGFNQEGGTVTGNIENLTIESKQNTSITKGSTKGGSLSIAPNGMPSGSASYSQTNGERRVVDSPTTFIIGDGSNLKVGKVENTAAAIGTTGNGKLSIDEYVGHNLENVDKLKTVGGSVGVSTSGITSLGVNYSDRKQEGITKNTVIGNVEIGKSSGDEINKDLDSMTEVTKDRDFKTDINIESQTINYIKNPEKFKEDLQKAKNEIHDIYHAVDSTVNLQGKEDRNILEQLGEVRQAKVILNVIGSRLDIAENQDDIAKAFEGVSEDLGYKVKVIYTDPSKSPQLIGVDKKGNTYIKNGTAYVDKKTGIGYILVNTESPANSTKAGVIGAIAEEQSHVIGKIEGRQKVVPDGSEKGLESLGKPTNGYFKKQYSKNDKAIGLKSDGKDYSNVDFGEHVGDWGPDDDHQVSSSKTYRTDNGAFKVIAKPKEGETEGEAIIDGRYKIEYTDDFNFSKEGKNPQKLARLKKRAKRLSEIDKDNNYIVTVSRKEGMNIIAVPKDKFWIENLVNDVDEGVQTVGKNFKELKKNSKDKNYGKAVLSLGKTVVSIPGIFQTGIGTTVAESVYNFKGGEVEYSTKKEILARRKANKDATKGMVDNLVGLAIATSAPNKIGGGNYPEYSLELQPAQSIIAAGDGVTAIAGTGYNLQLVKNIKYLEGVSTGPGKGLMLASAVGSSSDNTEKNDKDTSNEKEEKLATKEEANKRINDTQNLGNKNGDLYYEGRKVYTAKELNQMGRKKGGSPNKGIEYVYESPAGKPNAQEFQWGTEHSMMQNTPAGKKNIVPVLRYDNSNTRGMNFIKFDGIEVENGVTCLIDAKTNIPFWEEKAMKTVEGTLNRIRIAKSQNPGIRVIYEFPKKEAAEKMNNWLNNNPSFIGIVEVRVRK